MSNPARIQAPNYTQIPNAIFDLMADKGAGLTEKELKVLLAIARKTFGWHKKRDKISLTQLEELTSLSRPSVVAGLEAAIERGIVRRTPDKNDKRGGVFYELVVEEMAQSDQMTSKDFELVNNSNQLKELTKTSKDFELELVKNINTQKKEKEKKESGVEETQAEPSARPLSELAIAIATACKINPKIPTPKQKAALNETYKALKSIGATPADVQARETWWYANAWQAKKEGRAPRPDELQAIWDEAAAPIKQHTNGERKVADLPLVKASPRQTPEEQAAAAARRRAILAESRSTGK